MFVVDEVSDVLSGEDARSTGKALVKAMRDPGYDDNTILTKIMKEYASALSARNKFSLTRWSRFGARVVHLAGPDCSQRFFKCWESYIAAVAKEADLRERGEVLNLKSYTDLRRENSAIRTCLALIEYAMGTNLPEEVFEDEAFSEVYVSALDLIWWSNVRTAHFCHFRSH